MQALRAGMPYDVLVLGAGPAGAAAALEACASGLTVALVDEAAAAGGQVYRVAPGIGPRRADADPERRAGDVLRRALAAAAVDTQFGQRVWQVERDGDAFAAHAVGPEGPVTWHARSLIVAGGALERHVPIPGWERPGVLGLAAATVLLKAQRMLPGRHVVVAGTGPLLLAVAAGIVKVGGRVAAVVDARPRRAWLADWRGLASRPDQVARGARWLATLVAHRTPLFHAAMLRRIEGDPGVTHVEIAAVTGSENLRASRTLRIACDAVCVGFGLTPATDVTRLLGAAHAYDAARGGWHVVTDADQATSVPGLFVCGDAAGIAGAAAAPWSGRIAALAAARHLGRSDTQAGQVESLRREHARAARFGAAMTRMADVDDRLLADLPDDTLVCLCERLPRRAVDAAVDAGARTLGEVKAATRCGMGPCGGRVCEDAAARLIALRTGASRAEIGQATGRPPLRPVELDRLAGDFDYDALPIAQPAPL